MHGFNFLRQIPRWGSSVAFLLMMCASLAHAEQIAFPNQRPRNGNFNPPDDGARLDISPPGFCWWRAGPRHAVQYRLTIYDQAERIVYRSAELTDPVHVPEKVLPAGSYTWQVAATTNGEPAATLGPRRFIIANDAIPLPWESPEALLQKVSAAHPRLLFPADQLDAFRASLGDTRQKAYGELRAIADRALALDLMPKPTFDRFDRETQYAARRVAYRQSYHEFSRTYHQGMLPLAAVYVLTGERRYGEAAKAHLLNLLDWEVDGIASLELSFDEIGLRIQRTAAQGYDWLYDLLTPAEREAVKQMLIAHGNAMLDRLKRRDFLNHSAYSHDGRLPGYLVEFSIALAEEPVAREWMDYALRALLTVFPHWAGADGGWAEGINYSLSYNDRFITPLQSLDAATGYDLFQKPFFRKFRDFAMYNVAPNGDTMPFGDGEENPVSARADELYSILYFHALRYQDPVTRWWIELLPRQDTQPDRLGALHRLLLPDTLSPHAPTDLPPDRAFYGVGWAALHTDLTRPEDDLMVMFKSSPYGSVSHSHADQNSFVILKGGDTLAIPAGARFPQHVSPFHEQYTQQTVAHNGLLIDGQGQRNRDETASGRLIRFRSLSHLAYVAGDASACYPRPLDKCVRHVVLVRPSLVIVVDDVQSDEPVEVSWLMHTKDEATIAADRQMFTVVREEKQMAVHLASSAARLAITQTDEWPMPPKEGYPMVEAADPPRQWHLSATTIDKAATHRLAAVMAVGDHTQMPVYNVVDAPHSMMVHAIFDDGEATAWINQSPGKTDSPLVHVAFEPTSGEREALTIP